MRDRLSGRGHCEPAVLGWVCSAFSAFRSRRELLALPAAFAASLARSPHLQLLSAFNSSNRPWTARGIRPLAPAPIVPASPSIEYVLPLPVCPYANTVHLNPSSTRCTIGATTSTKTCRCDVSGPKTRSKSKCLSDLPGRKLPSTVTEFLEHLTALGIRFKRSFLSSGRHRSTTLTLTGPVLARVGSVWAARAARWRSPSSAARALDRSLNKSSHASGTDSATLSSSSSSSDAVGVMRRGVSGMRSDAASRVRMSWAGRELVA